MLFSRKTTRKCIRSRSLISRAMSNGIIAPNNDRLCNEEAVWFTQNMLLGTTADMDDIANAIEKIVTQADKLHDCKNEKDTCG